MKPFDPPTRPIASSSPRSSNRCRAVVWAAMAGAVLLPILVFSVWERKTLLTGEAEWEAFPLLPTAFSIPIGAFVGCILGFCFWIIFARRVIQPLYVPSSWGVSSFAMSLPLDGLYWSAETPPSPPPDGLGSTMRAIGLFWNYVLVVMPASVIGGLMLGWVAGVVKRNRRDGDFPTSGAE